MIAAVALVLALFGGPDYSTVALNPVQIENLKPGAVVPPLATPATPCPCRPPADAVAVAAYLRAHALATGQVVELNGELVDATLDLSVWAAIAGCESGGRWFIAPRSSTGPSGYVQIILPTWISYGGLEFAPAAYLAPPSDQLVVARRILDGGGWGQWSCAQRVGFR